MLFVSTYIGHEVLPVSRDRRLHQLLGKRPGLR